MEHIETVVIGAGQAGLIMSRQLRNHGCEHVVLERARIAERWRTQRWDSLMFQFPNWTITLAGPSFAHGDPDGFSHKDQIVQLLEDYCAATSVPVRTGVNVRSLTAAPEAGRYKLETDHGDITARNVVIATGPYQRPKVPGLTSSLPHQIAQVTRASTAILILCLRARCSLSVRARPGARSPRNCLAPVGGCICQ
jgi:putative flavoprotein involved in K+ transport